VTEKPMVRSGRDDVPSRVLHIHDAISLDAEWPDACALQSFTGHRLYCVSPNLCQLHGVNSFLIIVASSFFLRS